MKKNKDLIMAIIRDLKIKTIISQREAVLLECWELDSPIPAVVLVGKPAGAWLRWSASGAWSSCEARSRKGC